MSVVAKPKAHSGRFGALDGIRGTACYLVIATHVGYESGRSFDHGVFAPWLARLDVTVPIFLMLSGFLLYRPFAANVLADAPLSSFRSFWWRRALRVLPAYWLSVSVTLGLLSARHATGGDWLSYLGLAQVYNHHQVDSSLSQLWTLGAEVCFYLLLPFLGGLARRRNGSIEQRFRRQILVLAVLVVLALCWQISVSHLPAVGYEGYDWLPANVDWFAGGMLLAVLSRTPAHCTAFRKQRDVLKTWAESPVLCWTLALILYWFVTSPIGGPLDLRESTPWEWITRHDIETLIALLLMLPMTIGEGGRLGALFSRRPLTFLGEISYGVYLWHLPMLVLFQRTLHMPIFQGHFWQYYLLTASSATILGTLSWYYFERPLLRRFSRPDVGVRRTVPPDTAEDTNRTPAPTST